MRIHTKNSVYELKQGSQFVLEKISGPGTPDVPVGFKETIEPTSLRLKVGEKFQFGRVITSRVVQIEL